jgi:hypothetical protein
MLLTVPVDDGRYLWPLFPILAFGLLNGGRVIVARMRPGMIVTHQHRVVFIATAALVLSSMLFRPSEEPQGSLASVAAVQEVFDHLRTAASTDDQMRVAFVKPRILSWETRIPAMGTFIGSPDSILETLRRNRITRVVLGDHGLSPRADAAFRAAVAQTPEAFHLQFENEGFSVYRFAERH